MSVRVPWGVICLLLSAAPYIASDEGDVCAKVPGSSCACVFPNGTGINLEPSSLGSFVEARTFSESGIVSNKTVSMRTFYFHPCKDIQIDVLDKSITNGCNVPVAICKHDVEMEFILNQTTTSYNVTYRVDRYEKYGVSSKSHFTNDGRAIIYEGNLPSMNTVQLECAPLSVQDTLYVNDKEPNNVTLTFYSKNACLTEVQNVSHRSLGSTLLIIFFTIFLFYVVLGVCTKKFLMGAQGLEIIPNLAFWRGLPSLCSDGWQFVRNGFKVPPRSATGPTTSPDPNSYDSI